MALSIRVLQPYLPGGVRAAGTTVDLVVLHSTAGSERSPASADNAIATLKQRGLSYHYIITKDGSVIKCLPVGQKAYHAGSSYGPHEAERGISTEQNASGNFVAGTSVNGYSIGISFVNEDNGLDPYTEAQTASLIELLQVLKSALPSIARLTTHADVAPHRKVDPHDYDARALADRAGLTYWSRG